MSDILDDLLAVYNASDDSDTERVVWAAREEIQQLRAQVAALEARLREAGEQKPVAYMHNKRADVIHTSVKSLLSDFAVNSGPESMLRPIDKSEHYTIPLYAAPVPAQPAVPEAVAKAWIPHDGGLRPVDPDTKVIGLRRDGEQTIACRASFLHWEWAGFRDEGRQLVGYRILSATDTEVKK